MRMGPFEWGTLNVLLFDVDPRDDVTQSSISDMVVLLVGHGDMTEQTP